MFAMILAETQAGTELVGLSAGIGGAILIMAGKWAFVKARGNGKYPCAQHGERLASQETAMKALTKLLDERTGRIEAMLTELFRKLEER